MQCQINDLNFVIQDKLQQMLWIVYFRLMKMVSINFWKINCYIYNGGSCWMPVQTWNGCISRWGCFLRISCWWSPLSSSLMVLWFGGGWVCLIDFWKRLNWEISITLNSELTKKDYTTSTKTTFDSGYGGMPYSFEQSWKCPFINFL